MEGQPLEATENISRWTSHLLNLLEGQLQDAVDTVLACQSGQNVDVPDEPSVAAEEEATASIDVISDAIHLDSRYPGKVCPHVDLRLRNTVSMWIKRSPTEFDGVYVGNTCRARRSVPAPPPANSIPSPSSQVRAEHPQGGLARVPQRGAPQRGEGPQGHRRWQQRERGGRRRRRGGGQKLVRRQQRDEADRQAGAAQVRVRDGHVREEQRRCRGPLGQQRQVRSVPLRQDGGEQARR